ncbi:unnamed protein product [Allacma fusca]|uniref:Uncharacterized protein n=1 Tax=Allacma fusca TaxID=39272 RepID=A0A8J2JL13_9HEXA|nr:unnamed protein product [Allacma fusca]
MTRYTPPKGEKSDVKICDPLSHGRSSESKVGIVSRFGNGLLTTTNVEFVGLLLMVVVLTAKFREMIVHWFGLNSRIKFVQCAAKIGPSSLNEISKHSVILQLFLLGLSLLVQLSKNLHVQR